MATAVAFPPVDPGDIIPLDPNEIELGERLRPIDAAFAAFLGASMKADGQIHPVDVWRTGSGWYLAGAGGHRVTGARLAGIPIDCRVVEYDASYARRREAAENLFRRANDPLERAEAIAELVRLHRERAGIEEANHRASSVPKRLKEEADGTLAIVANVYGWTKEIAAEIGFAERTIRNDLFLYRGLQPSIVQLLREKRHPVLKNASQLRALAKLAPSEQRFAAHQLVNGLAKTANEAIRRSRGSNSVTRSAEDKRLSAFLDNFKRMSLSEQRGALAHLSDMLPAPFKLVEDR
jgi:ParB family chromosome partitioning protein